MAKCEACGQLVPPKRSIIRQLQEARAKASGLSREQGSGLWMQVDAVIGELEALAAEVDRQDRNPYKGVISPREVRVRLAGTAPLPVGPPTPEVRTPVLNAPPPSEYPPMMGAIPPVTKAHPIAYPDCVEEGCPAHPYVL